MARTPKYRGSVLKVGLTPDDVARFEINRYEFPGVAVKAGLTRNYPLGQSGAHIIGYVGGISEAEMENVQSDLYQGLTQIGKAGIERSHEDVLRGRPGYKIVEANAGGRPLRDLESANGEPGKNLYLSIDARLQLTAEQALGDDDGAVVAIDPRNGEILAMVSKPGFDPAPFVDGIDFAAYKALNTDPSRPLFNRAIQGQYPPGSTVKPFIALGGLHYGQVTPATRVFCSGTFYLPNSDRKFRCHKRRGHGSVDMLTAIAKSCDIYFYQLALNLTIDRFDAAMGAFGFGEPTGIDIPNEKGGLLPTREWKRRVRRENWLPGETINVGIGQGFLTVTPLQMAQATARMAMRGNGFRPHFVHASEDQLTGAVTPEPTVALPPIFPDEMGHFDTIFNAMTTVVMSPAGTGYRIGAGAPYQIAGKTGTAQVSGLAQDETAAPNMATVPKKLRDHAWFMGFAPVNDPEDRHRRDRRACRTRWHDGRPDRPADHGRLSGGPGDLPSRPRASGEPAGDSAEPAAAGPGGPRGFARTDAGRSFRPRHGDRHAEPGRQPGQQTVRGSCGAFESAHKPPAKRTGRSGRHSPRCGGGGQSPDASGSDKATRQQASAGSHGSGSRARRQCCQSGSRSSCQSGHRPDRERANRRLQPEPGRTRAVAQATPQPPAPSGDQRSGCGRVLRAATGDRSGPCVAAGRRADALAFGPAARPSPPLQGFTVNTAALSRTSLQLNAGITAPHRRGEFWRRWHIDPWLLMLLPIVGTIGLATIYSATGHSSSMVVSQAFRLLMGIGLMILVAQMPPEFYRAAAPWLYGITLGLLVLVLVVGDHAMGAQRWLDLKVIRFQPSELMKFGMPMMVAAWLHRYTLPPRWWQVLTTLLLILLPWVLVVKQPDLGTSLLILAAGFFALFFAGLRWRWLLGAAIATVGGGYFGWAHMHEYQRKRVLTFLNPDSDPLGAGYHINQAKIAIGSGGLFGKGYGHSTQANLDFLPEAHTDFIFAVFCEEWGLVGVAVLLTLYIAITLRGVAIALRGQDTFQRLLAAALTFTFFLYVFINMGMVMGIVPVVGVPLPLMSYGGTSAVSLLAGFGMLMSIHTHKKLLAN